MKPEKKVIGCLGQTREGYIWLYYYPLKESMETDKETSRSTPIGFMSLWYMYIDLP